MHTAISKPQKKPGSLPQHQLTSPKPDKYNTSKKIHQDDKTGETLKIHIAHQFFIVVILTAISDT
ncbi:hypothetical protein [Gynuella sunshinyii]|uniref:Uncharacterized protein n=1 Tax=Gynuella sunshinyii YC6258 TaxID=1445510 RepID=A0A0C5W0G3_9GAMM|nr:hypothetical protein [Gynuella sunshinyii]AJQ96179.1 hypothetical Protein YC6258_04143 [Gynuella sunshinyii YC6258]